VGANNLEDGDEGYGGDGVRKCKATKSKGMGKLIKYLGFEWYANKEFEINHLTDYMVAAAGIVPGRTNVAAGTELYLVLWKGFPPEIATWEVRSRLRAAARASGLWACLLRSPPLVFPGRVWAPRALHRRVRRPGGARGERRRGGGRGGGGGGGGGREGGGGGGRAHGRCVTRRRVCMRCRAAVAVAADFRVAVLRVFLEIRACCFWRVSLVCAVCALCAACIGVIRAHNVPGGGKYIFF